MGNPVKYFFTIVKTWCLHKTVQDTCGSGVMLGPAGLFHCWTGAATLASDRLPLWQSLIKDCPFSYVSMTASGLTNVTKLCFVSKSPMGPSQESIWIRRENYSSCSLLLTGCALCVWSDQPWLATFLCNLQYLLCGAEPVLTQYIFHLLRSFICCFGNQVSSKGLIKVLEIEAPVEVLQGALGTLESNWLFLRNSYRNSDSYVGQGWTCGVSSQTCSLAVTLKKKKRAEACHLY